MTRIQTACYCLLASAFVLTTVLLVKLDSSFVTPAQADLVINRDTFTIMTARTSQNEESVFVLDNTTQRLLIYKADIGRKQLELSEVVELARVAGEQRRVPPR